MKPTNETLIKARTRNVPLTIRIAETRSFSKDGPSVLQGPEENPPWHLSVAVVLVISLNTDMCSVHTHDAGAELLVRDLQRVSVSVEPPASPVICPPVPVLQVRHLPSLETDSGALQSLRLKTHETVGPEPCLHLPGSCGWRRAPAGSGPRWSW